MHDHEIDNSEGCIEKMQTQAIDKTPSQRPPLKTSNSVKVIKSVAVRYPNTAAICCLILLPMLFLIGVSFLSGFILATLEIDQEVESNQEFLRQQYYMAADVYAFHDVHDADKNNAECFSNYTAPVGPSFDRSHMSANIEACISSGQSTAECFTNYNAPVRPSFNRSHIIAHTDTCIMSFQNDTQNELYELVSKMLTTQILNSPAELSFNWMICANSDVIEKSRRSKPDWTLRQINADHVNSKFHQSIVSLLSSYTETKQSLSYEEVFSLAVKNARGHDDCKVNTSGGAIFWFTIMTTIGYGNIAPVSVGGRACIYILGFLSVLLFTAVTGEAAFVSLVLFDKCVSKRVPRLKEGLTAAIFWCFCYFIWNFIIGANIIILYKKNYVNLDLGDAYWFAYITTTTIGFGDYYPPPLSLHWYSIFVFSGTVLIGFVLLANFALKFTTYIISLIPEKAFKIKNRFEDLAE
mmetsp:Transcript_27273/g.54546  ORF Transcript_27273/g.54546 Transcript_27273/m.54546 type:complete len:466 (+) Transcript_27273:38-1435(+)